MQTTPTHTGRPLDSNRDAELRRAALELVGEVGYDRLTIDAVAARAHAGKATVYRRWASKAQLVADAFREEMFGGLVTPDTGSLRGDLLSFASQIWGGGEAGCRAGLLAGLMSALLANPELRAALHEGYSPPQAVLETLIDRAVARGEISAPADVEIIGSVVPSMCTFRFVKTGEAPDFAFFEAVIDRLVLPALQRGSE